MHPSTTTILHPRKVGDLEGTFFVPDYQRGYRWGEDEVRRLLDDIKEAGGRELLPPAGRREADAKTVVGSWSTASSASRRCTSSCVTSSSYLPTAGAPLHADLRDPAGQRGVPRRPPRGGQPREHRLLPHVPGLRVHRGLVRRAGRTRRSPPSSSSQALTSTVYVIWYEAPQEPEFDSRALFTRLNVGRIPLTDAELVKALAAVADRARARDRGAVGQHRARPAVARRSGRSRPAQPTAAPPASACCSTPSRTRSPARRPARPRRLPHVRDAPAAHRGRPAGAVGPGRRPALAGPRLVRRPQPVPQDRLPRRRAAGRRSSTSSSWRRARTKSDLRARTRRADPRRASTCSWHGVAALTYRRARRRGGRSC